MWNPTNGLSYYSCISILWHRLSGSKSRISLKNYIVPLTFHSGHSSSKQPLFECSEVTTQWYSNWGHKYVFPGRNSNQARTTHRLWKDLCRARVYQCKIFSGQIWSCMEIFTAKKEWVRKETGLHTSRNSPTNPQIKQPEVMSIKARSTVVLSPSATQLSYFYLSSRKQYILIVNNPN